MERMLSPLSVAAAFNLATLGELLLAQATPEDQRSDEQRALVAQRRVPTKLGLPSRPARRRVPDVVGAGDAIRGRRDSGAFSRGPKPPASRSVSYKCVSLLPESSAESAAPHPESSP